MVVVLGIVIRLLEISVPIVEPHSLQMPLAKRCRKWKSDDGLRRVDDNTLIFANAQHEMR